VVRLLTQADGRIELAKVGVNAATEPVRAKRQGVVNEVRRPTSIARAESGKATRQATIEFLKELDRDTSQQVVQRVALQADVPNVRRPVRELSSARSANLSTGSKTEGNRSPMGIYRSRRASQLRTTWMGDVPTSRFTRKR
jgi:hypothetical protein